MPLPPNPWEIISEQIENDAGVASGMQAILDHCRELYPSSMWEQIAALDFTADTDALVNWLRDLLTAEPPSAAIEAFWFGLYEDELPQGEQVWQLYLSGSDYYDPDDRTGHWAVSPEYFPDNRYAKSAALRRISDVLRGRDPNQDSPGAYLLVLGYACLAVREACRRLPEKLLLGSRGYRACAVGFDDGDFLILPSIRVYDPATETVN